MSVDSLQFLLKLLSSLHAEEDAEAYQWGEDETADDDGQDEDALEVSILRAFSTSAFKWPAAAVSIAGILRACVEIYEFIFGGYDAIFRASSKRKTFPLIDLVIGIPSIVNILIAVFVLALSAVSAPSAFTFVECGIRYICAGKGRDHETSCAKQNDEELIISHIFNYKIIPKQT